VAEVEEPALGGLNGHTLRHVRISPIVNTPIGHRERSGATLALGESSGYAEHSLFGDEFRLKSLFVPLRDVFQVFRKGL